MLIINGIIWRVILVNPYHPMLRRPDGFYTIGSCCNNNHTIYINEMLNEQMKRKVLRHEITHAVLFSYNILLDIDDEETFADLVATFGEEIIETAEKIEG